MNLEKFIDSIQKIIDSIGLRLENLFLQSFGDQQASASGDVPLPIDAAHEFKPIISMSISSKLVVQNIGANEIEVTWNPQMAIGFRIAANDGEVLDNVIGTLFARVSDPTKASTLNFLAVAIRTS